MHKTQRAILDLATKKNISKMSLREIGRIVAKRDVYPQIIKYHITQLLENNLLVEDKKTGELRVNSAGSQASHFYSLPIMGSADCGPAQAIADDNIVGYLPVSKSVVGSSPERFFVVQASGKSMVKAKVGKAKIGIDDGDYVIVDREDKDVEDDDYVLSVIDGLANIKKIHQDRKHGQITLISEADNDYPPIFIHPDDSVSYYVAGKVKCVIKKPLKK